MCACPRQMRPLSGIVFDLSSGFFMNYASCVRVQVYRKKIGWALFLACEEKRKNKLAIPFGTIRQTNDLCQSGKGAVNDAQRG